MKRAIAHTRLQTPAFGWSSPVSLQELKEQACKLYVSDRRRVAAYDTNQQDDIGAETSSYQQYPKF
ncbi:hypothetical protein [Chroococcidiopsis sp. CCMEE 29]|uniref:hypothetical protein n=1 Tax=Chroococcidiopsis sp. CCMEE 29 TaxID=155894 RepID=UPI00201FDA8B|nr:hypothetical protein [Chroococcidiopsis sp. CCMEE 29]